MARMLLPVNPVPKPRMTRSDAWKQRPPVLRYFAYKDELRSLVKGELDPVLELVFHVPMPKSWSQAKRESYKGKPHQQKPDIDNYLKAFLDALCEDDSYVYKVTASKYWAEEGGIDVYEPLSEKQSKK